MEIKQKKLFSTGEVSKILGISRVAIHKRIISGLIKAEKVGRNYVIENNEVNKALNLEISEEQQEEINSAVKKAVNQYRSTFERLAKEE